VTDKAQMIDLNMDLANVLLLTSDFEGAAAAYRDVLSLDPGNVSALNNIAFVTAQELKDPAKAMPYAEQAAQLAPQDGSVLDTVGWVHFLAGNTDKARQYLTDSLRLDKNNGTTHVHMAEVLVKTGDFDGAVKQLDEAEKQRLDSSTKKKIDTLREEIGKKRTPAG
jgi:Tfp pilus assembly protein PilF